jgi:flagellar biogenesis protein FliO
MTKALILFFSLILTTSVFAEVTVKNLKFKTVGDKGVLKINYDGNLVDYPELKINQNSVYILIPNAKVKKTINKEVKFTSSGKNTKLNASQLSTKVARVKVIVPFTITKVKEKVTLTLRDNQIELSFPKLAAQTAYLNTGKKSTIAKVNRKNNPKSQVAKDLLNEDYLNSLMKSSASKKAQVKPSILARRTKTDKTKKSNEDKVKTTLSSTKSTPKKTLATGGKSSFSLIEYGGKFVAFLGVVLLLFYGVITLMKKGFIKKGKLGFLNKTEQVSVLSQTYIAPKKSLMLIRAHNQVFLVSNTDSGIHPISEITDVAGLLKDGEKIIAGNNFDDSMNAADEDSNLTEKITLKDDITKSNKQSSLSEFIGVKDKVKFSDQLKKKVKDLKPLQ